MLAWEFRPALHFHQVCSNIFRMEPLLVHFRQPTTRQTQIQSVRPQLSPSTYSLSRRAWMGLFGDHVGGGHKSQRLLVAITCDLLRPVVPLRCTCTGGSFRTLSAASWC